MGQDIFLQEYYKFIYYIFQIKVFFRFSANISRVVTWKSIGFSVENIENITTSNRNFAPILVNYYPLKKKKKI